MAGGLVVGDVVEAGLLVLDEVENGAGGVVAVDLIEDANAEVSAGGVVEGSLFEGGFVVEEFTQDDAAVGTVDAGEAEGGSLRGEGEVFGLAEDG